MQADRFRRATGEDLATLHRWRETPAVRRWWIDADGRPSEPISLDDLAAPDVAMWIVSLGDRPFAFMQDYDPHAVAGHHVAHLPPAHAGSTSSSAKPT
ncbi:GNAT family N-acetyltransferase [Aureimonas sp. SK2]|uniref:GNAT family N-acetyltransferase n=1 Tax=Aureimonas sp. SK2 TaxID=3015992 RepID=UPI002444A66C|nr:GNAT family N-acetyltransferase [Aureimonas sp. SK2]